MAESGQPHDLPHDLTAFADGELDASHSADVLEYLCLHPEAAHRVARQMRFRARVGSIITAGAPPASQLLRDRLSKIVAREGALVRLSPLRSRMQLHLAVVAAALMFIAIGIYSGKLMFSAPPPGPLPVRMVSAATFVHVDCSRAPSLHNLPFPHELGTLEETLKRTLGRPVPYPDLSSIGYEYVGAGPCGRPLQGCAHLLYKSTRGPVSDTVSLFVMPFDARMRMDDGKVYWAAGRDAAHPMIAWRRGSLLFLLVGDAAQPVELSAGLMHVDVPL